MSSHKLVMTSAAVLMLLFAVRSAESISLPEKIAELFRREASTSSQTADSSVESSSPDAEAGDEEESSLTTAVPRSRGRRWTAMTIEELQSATTNLQSRSFCPWTYSYNVDLARDPSSLIQAHCTHVTVPGTSMMCKHVYQYIPVKKNVSGTIQDHWLKMKVGCTLASPPTVYQPPIST